MGLRSVLLWPGYRLAEWVDDNPVSTVGIVVALGSLAVLVGSATIGTGAEAGGGVSAAVDTGFVLETAIERPAYPATAIVGIAVALLYNG
jgi:hypothetical protein